ncbi:U3 small nucleolar RNA-associated protein 6 homolog [Rhopilema esculentum]|uniref:U3 small nucleolar RNA-associated protein 6 homolog n=1 Tax=Rhopilema esculentum TaxID=499914 RepID=UPI0031E30307
MAEYVYKNLESMLPELEDLEAKGIFDKNELRTIVKKRTELEYKLQRRVVEKKDFLKYLEYELNVDSLRRKRMQRMGLKPKHTTAEIGINKRMHHVFQASRTRLSLFLHIILYDV